jgi:hypothetical protein
MRVGTLIFLSENFPVCSVFPIARIAAFGSSYRCVVTCNILGEHLSL